jgi:hypothetical protein
VHRQRFGLLAATAAFAIAVFGREAEAVAITAQDAAGEAAQCQSAIVRASAQTGVPLRLLMALAPTESGLRRARGRGPAYPWPWTLNTNGRGSFHFRTQAAAEKHLSALVAAGVDNVDIGCMQVNWHWHSAAFASPAAALNPYVNTGYAAALLRDYRRQTGSWAEAVGLYHTHTPALAEAYRCRVAHALRPGQALTNCAP